MEESVSHLAPVLRHAAGGAFQACRGGGGGGGGVVAAASWCSSSVVTSL